MTAGSTPSSVRERERRLNAAQREDAATRERETSTIVTASFIAIIIAVATGLVIWHGM